MAPLKFLEIDPGFLQSIATDSDRVPTLYYSRYWPVRKFFWMRLKMLYQLILGAKTPRINCLDFGGGGGVFLPSLSNLFESVVCIDLNNEEAQKIIQEYRLANVKIIQEDISKARIQEAPFDAIVAADVLEHFQDLSIPVDVLRRWLGREGILYTSLPTENFIYTGLRMVFRIQKPWDHYHTGYEVEDYLKKNGFKRIRSACVPLYWNVCPLFLISAWKVKD